MAVSFNTRRTAPWSHDPMSTADFSAATAFIAANARILDWRRFQRLFQDGPAAPVRDAVAAYRNDDGGFGHALEPDGRAPGSQPAATEMALRIMNETDAWDEDLVRGACDWLAARAPPRAARPSWSRASPAGRTRPGGCPRRVSPPHCSPPA
jgi:hypothetical protein